MAKGRAGRTYTRDSNGRFASSGSTGRQRPASRPAPRGRNRLTRDNSGRITGMGDGATARGGRLRTGAGNLRATQTARLKGQGGKLRRPMGGGGGGSKSAAENSSKRQASTTRSAKQQAPAKGKRKVDVQIKRAAAGGEYGPDGHFYSGGSWMPLGGFKGGSKSRPLSQGAGVSSAKQSDKSDGRNQVLVIKQAKKERPRLEPTGPAMPLESKVSERGKRNAQDFFKSGYYTSYKKGRDGYIEIKPSGWLENAALATRFTPKQVGASIARLRQMAKDKKEFDSNVAWDRTLSTRQGAFGYEEARRGGYLPRGLTKNQYVRASQLHQAVNSIAAERSKRPGNRRTDQEEYVWVMNNMLGKRAPKSATGRAAMPVSRNRQPKPIARRANTLRPMSTRRMIAAGGNRWQKGAHDRIYFNVSTDGKVFYDRNTRKMNVQGYGDTAKLRREARKLQEAGRRPIPRRWKRYRIPST